MTFEPIQFTPTEDFFSDETKSQYCAGMSYKATNEAMLDLVLQWSSQGKVEITDIDPSLGTVSGSLDK